MPTYEYVCVDCGTHVEVFQRFSDEPLTACGVCGGRLRQAPLPQRHVGPRGAERPGSQIKELQTILLPVARPAHGHGSTHRA